MMLTTTAFAGQGPVNNVPSAPQAIGNVQTNSIRGLDVRKHHHRENMIPGTDIDIDDIDIESLQRGKC